MFENIIGQAATLETLRRELAAGCFPGAALLSGPPYAGKLSTALEIARVLTCGQRGQWSCACPSCRKQRLLVHPATLLAGARYFEADIAAAADCLLRVRKPPARYLFIRAVRKLTRRFDPPLWEGEESRLKPVAGALAQVEEELDALAPGDTVGEEPPGLEKRLEAVLAGCRQLARGLPAQNIPIHLLRRASAWLRLTAPGAGTRRVLILECAEGMLEASSNSLLKTLEEPPRNAFLILTTSRRAALAPTVLSRLRTYPFAERSPAETSEVLSRIFREEGKQYPNLREYFLAWQEVDPRAIASIAQRFVAAAGCPEEELEAEVLDRLSKLFGGKQARECAATFYQELLGRFGALLREGAVDPRRLARWNTLLRGHLEAFERYNQSPLLNLESLFLGLRSTA
jgi:DNA polymerase-3 subunit gamma/tau